MIGAVMLLMAATVGITYGWVPDGGDGVKYIIQIPPEKIDQVARSGEISSQIPAEIRGRVSEVVIRVGQGNLPRVTPGSLSRRSEPLGQSYNRSENLNAVAAADQIPVPIPSMSNPTDLRPIGMGNTSPTAMMKPAPQSGGMNMPGGFVLSPSTTPSTGFSSTPPATNGFNSASLEQAARDAANNAAKQYNAAAEAGRQQIQQNVHAATERLGDAANAQFQSATSGLQNAANDMLYGPTATPSTTDDPRTRLGQSGPVNGIGVPAPSTSPAYASTSDPRSGTASPLSSPGTPPASSFGAPPNFSTSAPNPVPSNFGPSSASPTAFGPTTTSSAPSTRTVATPPLSGPTRDEDWYALQNRAGNRPSTAPVESSAGGLTGGNFGQLPAGLQPGTNASTIRPNPTNSTSSGYNNDPRQSALANSGLDYDPNLSPSQAAQLPKNGYGFDAQGYPLDRQGYRIDHYGRRIDSHGHSLTAVDSMAGNDQSSGSNTNAGSGYASDRNQSNSSSPPLVQPPRSRPTMPDREADNYRPDTDPRYAGTSGRPANESVPAFNYERPRAAEDSLPSASDSRGRLDDKTPTRAGGLGELDSGPEPVAAQPIFNALLLLSVVANLYLLFWLKNMREQFREMVVTKRGAASGGSLATGI